MNSIELDRNTFTAVYRDEAVRLLPKEFMLLEYLNRNLGRTLSREQLLNAVWELEAPTERTVDDHVYRLRKKLSPWKDKFEIHTIRGAGYRLQAIKNQSGQKANPLLDDAVHASRMRELVETNLTYGRGDALLTLFKQQGVLGFELDIPFKLLIPFMEGHFSTFVNGEIPFEERVFFLLHLYHAMRPEASRAYVEAALRRRIMPSIWHNEVERYNIIFMLMDWGELDTAIMVLDDVWKDAMKDGMKEGPLSNLVPYLAIQRLKYKIMRRNWSGAERQIDTIERLITSYPFQREEGLFTVLKGIVFYRIRPKDAIAVMDEGIATLRLSRFVPHLAEGFQLILRFAAVEGWEALAVRYRPEWERLLQETCLEDILPAIEAELQKHL